MYVLWVLCVIPAGFVKIFWGFYESTTVAQLLLSIISSVYTTQRILLLIRKLLCFPFRSLLSICDMFDCISASDSAQVI